jgi:dipeptidyl aminopeptidase/acylaminoacyl peptidase
VLFSAGWSPDGETAALITSYNDGDCYWGHTGQNVLSIVNDAGTNRRDLARGGEIGSARWSRDGQRLAFTGNCDELCDLFVVSREGTGARRLTSFETRTFPLGGYDSLSFAWWGRELLYARGLSLFARDPDVGTIREVLKAPCPRLIGECARPQLELLDLSEGLVLFEATSYGPEIQERDSPPDVSRLYVAGLSGQAPTELPRPRPIVRGDFAGYSDFSLG